jgi:uncharacterized protein (DUF2236 family)
LHHPQYAAGTGLSGPRSVAWRIHRERITIFSWAPAVLMQIAHPLVAAGIDDHSVYFAQPKQRLVRFRRTLDAMLAFTFGDTASVQRAAAGVNAIHDRVHGRVPEASGAWPAGAPYSAHDPELLRWVHATTIDMALRAFQLYVAPLRPEEEDRYCSEASGLGPLLGIAEGFLPADRPALDAYLATMCGGEALAVTPTARRLGRDLLHPPGPALAGPLLWLMRLAAIGLLPPEIRAAYGFRWDARRERRLGFTAGLIRRLLPLLPPPLRYWPAARVASRQGPAPLSEAPMGSF